MTIKRTINGQEYEFELTENELRLAGWEHNELCDREDVETALDWFDDTRDVAFTKDQIDRAARKFRKWMDNWDEAGEARYEFAHDALREVAREDNVKLNDEEEA